jgi:hypothetical protein
MVLFGKVFSVCIVGADCVAQCLARARDFLVVSFVFALRLERVVGCLGELR